MSNSEIKSNTHMNTDRWVSQWEKYRDLYWQMFQQWDNNNCNVFKDESQTPFVLFMFSIIEYTPTLILHETFLV